MLNFADYNVSPQRGFLPTKDPLTELGPAFAELDQLGRELPYLVLTNRVRSTLDRFTAPNLDLLTTEAELERAMLIISALGMAYVWAEEPKITMLPAALAVPWVTISKRLGRPPIITHASIVLNNWRRIDPNDGIHADNLACIQHFMGGMDEQWFFTATAALEAAGAPALLPLAQAKESAATGDIDRVTVLLNAVHEVFNNVIAALLRIYEKCDPYIFYHRIRPFLTGWHQTGILFEGVSDKPLKLHGGSAAQSSLIQAFDAALGIEHLHPHTQPFLLQMRAYMPPKHRQFVEALAQGQSLYAFVNAQNNSSSELVKAFDRCIDALDTFRRAHMEVAVRYVLNQGPTGNDGLGTGGTSFVPFLSEARKETKAKRITNR